MKNKYILSTDTDKADNQIDLLFNFITDNEEDVKLIEDLQEQLQPPREAGYKSIEDLPQAYFEGVAEHLIDFIRERIHLW